MNDRFADRRHDKNKRRHDKWQERQERSKVTRDEISQLIHARTELRRKLDLRAESESSANVVETATAARAEGTTANEAEGEDTAINHNKPFRYFNELPLSQRTQMGLERGNYTKLTPVQSDSLHLSLAGYDVLGAAKTGSGKTLCYIIPVLEKLLVEHWDSSMGLGALVLSPTRELALQIFKVLQLVGYKHVFSAALLTGGRDITEEKKRLPQISIIVGTPGRVLHHFEDCAELVLDNVQLFIMDEADRLLDMGFRDAITSIMRYLPPHRQTLLFSATQTTDVKMLAQMSLEHPRYVTSQEIVHQPTPATLSQNFLVVELHRKLDALLLFLKRHPHDKIIIFASTCNQVKFMYLAFSKILKKMRIPSMCLTSKMKQFRREEVFLTFCRCKSAALFCTDVAARGLDFPLVHWVVHYDCPDSPQTYVHRAGRTARAGAKGASVLFLTPSETPMLSYLAQRNVKLREIAIKPNLFHVSSQDIFVALVVQGLKYEAQKAFIAYLRSVYFASNKHVFNMAAIDVEAFAKSLGLLVVPDTSELQNMQRGAKNMPWAIANYVEQNKHKKQVASDDDEEAEGGAAKGSMTRKEKHLKASDMFRLLEQKQKFAAKDGSLFGGTAASAAVHDDEEDDFLVKKTPSAAAQKDMEKDRQLTVDERMAGLSKNKIKRFIETPDLRVRDLNLSRHRVFRDDSDDEVVEVTADEEEEASQEKKKTAKTGKDGNADDDNAAEERERAALLRQAVLEGKKQQRLQQAASADSEDDEGTSDESETEFTEKLRSRIHGVKGEDAVRSKKMRQLRKLQKAGKVSRQGAAGGAAGRRPRGGGAPR
ncbi:ATP-dependent RNA helicase DDX10/DBP4 [Strigomonas culicis]|uniref:ATP-dependent RNA helicase n=1 Tax=Strigomonas culicis TaxID=28005 RepID=S9TUC9_9TRYP|nr:ATP-dependent RNA helicase DDX10/DBP4 [Strigomonas culicis]|eukprot:EPY20149.1 ATP-dependent RNA helicase DDX10/DBP4 [Strigomonas culicis]